MFPEIGVPQNGWFIIENLIKMDDLGVPLFLEAHRWWQLKVMFLCLTCQIGRWSKNLAIAYFFNPGLVQLNHQNQDLFGESQPLLAGAVPEGRDEWSDKPIGFVNIERNVNGESAQKK